MSFVQFIGCFDTSVLKPLSF